MPPRLSPVDSSLAALDQQLSRFRASDPIASAMARWRGDAAALRFHLCESGTRPPIVAILGGTGTGKSTILNRLVARDVSAASFRRTFTAGAVAVTAQEKHLPPDWLGIEHALAPADQLPARGEPDRLLVVLNDGELTRRVTLVDTPDLDGDQPAHHAQADRVFRWSDAIVLLVTPEKYQMTELLPYYRLARRYAVPVFYVMNKAEQQGAVEDYRAQLGAGGGEAGVYAVPRDDAGYEPPPEINLGALRVAVSSPRRPDATAREAGLRNRIADLLDRLHDQIIAPLREQRRAIDAAVRMLRSMETPETGIDVNPLTRQLQRRLQQRSILYLIGPARVLDRVRQVPGLLARLPRTAWDLVMRGKAEIPGAGSADEDGRHVPDFRRILAEQLAVLQSRIDDVIRSSGAGEKWIADSSADYKAAMFEPERAAQIADDELAQLKAWLEKRWNATPRDTAVLQKVLRHLPGGEKLTRWSEAAPYLLTIIVATHGAFFGHLDLLIIGGYSLATWMTERLSNEVAARTRQANRRIADRFERLAHEQIDQACKWLESCAPSAKEIDQLARAADTMSPSD